MDYLLHNMPVCSSVVYPSSAGEYSHLGPIVQHSGMLAVDLCETRRKVIEHV